MAAQLANVPAHNYYLGFAAKKTKAQRGSTARLGQLAGRYQDRYGSDVFRSIQKKGAKRKGLLSRIAAEGYRG